MKLFSVFSFFLLNAFFLKAQILIENISMVKSDTNLLYYNLENELKISGINNFKLSSTSSNIEFVDDRIIVSPKENQFLDTIIIKKNNKIIFKKVFAICKVNEADLFISGLKRKSYKSSFKDTLSINQLLNKPRLEFLIPNCFYKKANFTIVSFDLYIQNATIAIELSNEGGDFSQSFLDEIKKLHVGDKIFFDNVKVLGPDNNIRNVGSRNVIIK